jgi:ATP-dependent phosphoenolpyruvate carboxykinase
VRSVAKPLATRALATSSFGELGLTSLGLKDIKANYNLTYDEVAEHEKANGEVQWTNSGTAAVDTGIFTGRSPKDKWIVKQAPSESEFWWGSVNQPTTPEVFDELYDKVLKHYESVPEAYVFDGYCGANPTSRRNVRIVTELAWQHHFCKNMFIRPKSLEEVKGFKPDYTIINACKVTNDDYERHGLNSPVFVAFNVEKRVAVLGGTWYGGEMKKGIFSMMNFWLPLADIMPMHCSANQGKDGDTALFFGLSGTGKTTLSADPKRFLIGDDEHGWDDDGIFNFEGGCYAKTIDLSREKEPEVWDAIKRNALLENVKLDAEGVPDYTNREKTENSRVSYPLEHIPNHLPSGMGGHPDNIIFLTADAYGVLPPVSVLTPDQAMFHFLSGYTAKVAGTERGVTEPQATFSACFGAAFMTLHPSRYADLLKRKIETHGSKVYLVNTGWTGGPYGTGERISIPNTRACIDAILDGSIRSAPTVKHPVFNVEVPTELPGVETALLDPRGTWANAADYDATANKLAQMFQDNFEQYKEGAAVDYSQFGPKPV